MARWRKVHIRLWGDAKVRALSWPPPNGLTLFQRLLTGPETHAIPGIVVATEHQLASALRWDIEGFREAFLEVSSGGLAKSDWDAGVVWLPKGVRHNPPQSPNVVKSWVKAWDDLPDTSLKPEIISVLKAFLEDMGEAYAEPFESLSGSKIHGLAPVLDHPLRNQEQEKEQEKEQEQEQEQEQDGGGKPSPRGARAIPNENEGRQVLAEINRLGVELSPKWKPLKERKDDLRRAAIMCGRHGIDRVLDHVRARVWRASQSDEKRREQLLFWRARSMFAKKSWEIGESTLRVWVAEDRPSLGNGAGLGKWVANPSAREPYLHRGNKTYAYNDRPDDAPPVPDEVLEEIVQMKNEPHPPESVN